MNRKNDLMNLFKDVKQNKDQIFFRAVDVKRGIPAQEEMKQNSINTILKWLLNL